MRRPRAAAAVIAAFALAAAGLAWAQEMPRLPGDVTLPRGADSPGPVVFSHQTHVAVQARVDCTACHPKVAPIVTTASARREPITHARMEQGRSCGACHNGTAAHGFEDCSSCHKG